MDTFNRKQVYGNGPSGASPLYVRFLQTRYELLSSLSEYVETLTQRRLDHREMTDRFESQGDGLFIRVAPLDVRGIIRWLATDNAVDILQRANLGQVTIVRDDSLTPLQI